MPWQGGRAENVMWDVSDPNVFAVAEQGMVHVYLYLPVSITGVLHICLCRCWCMLGMSRLPAVWRQQELSH